MKNICIFNGNMARTGGTERCTAILANELSKFNNEYKVFVIDISNPDKKCFFTLANEVKLHHIHGNNLFDITQKIYSFFKQNNINVVINVEAMLGIYTMPVCKLLKIKNIIWEHGNFYQKQCKTIDLVRALEIKLCDYYVTLTERDMNNFKSHFKGKCKIDYIYNPITLPQDEIYYNFDSKTIISVGLVRHIKGFDMIPDIAKLVFEKHPDWKWEIYGNDMVDVEYTNSIKSKLKEYHLENNVVFKGNTNNIEEIYKKASMMVMTSRMEGLPMTLLEAKAHKLPLVAFDIQTGPAEIIDNNINGYLINPYNTQHMADKICCMIENDVLRCELSNNSYVGIERFKVNEIIDKWISIIK